MADLDKLTIQINAQSQKANTALDNLITKLDKLTLSLAGVDGSKLSGLASGVSQLGMAMQTMNGVKTTDFTRLAKNITTLNGVDTSQLGSVSTSITSIGTSLSGLSGVSDGAKQLSELASGIKQLGYKSAGQAIQNIPQLATAMKQLMKELSTAPRVSQNLIDMTNALAKLSRTGSSSGKAVTSLTSSLNTYSKATTTVRTKSFNLASAIGKVYATYWMFFRAIGKVKDAIDISSSLTEVQNVVDVTFGKYASLVEDMSKTSITDFGMSELTVKEVSSRFQAMGTAIGFSQGKMAEMSVELTKLTADIASFYDMEQKDVAQDLESIFTGQTRPLRTYGLDLTEATLKEWALKEGLNADISSMSQAEKTLLRYKYVLANTTNAQGDFLRTADTWSNQVRILKQNLQQLASIIGGTLINAFKPFVKAMNNAMSHITAFARTISNALGKIFGWKFEETGGGVASTLEDSVDSAEGMASGIGTAADNAEKLKKTLSVLSFDELNQLSATNQSSGSGTSGNGGTGTGTGTLASDGGWTKTESILKTFESEINNLYSLGKYIGDTLSETLSSIDWDKIYEKARGFGKGLADFMNGLISPKTFRSVAETIAGALNTALHVLDSYGTTFNWVEFGNSIAAGINHFFDKFDFGVLAHTIKTWANGLLDSMITAIKKIKWSEIGEKIGNFLADLDFLEIAKKMAQALWEAINAAISTFTSMFSKAPIETALLSAVTVPKILDKISSTKIVTNLSNLVNGAERLGKKLLGLEEPAKKASDSIGDLKDSTQETNTIMGRFKKTVTQTQQKMKLFKKISIGSAGLLTDLSLTQNAVYDLATDSESLNVSLGKIASGAGIAFGALKMIGMSNPFAAVLTSVTSLLGAITGLDTALGEKAEIERYGDTLDNINQKFEQSTEDIKQRHEASVKYVEEAGVSEIAMAESLAERYFELTAKENLTNNEKAEMQRISEKLVEYLPELQNFYDTETGLITATKDAVEDLIEQRLNEIKVQAAEESLLDMYQQQNEAWQNMSKYLDTASKSKEEWNRLNDNVTQLEDLYKMFQEYQNVSQQIREAGDNTGELTKKQEELKQQLEDSGLNIDWYADDGGILNYIDDAQVSVRDFKDEYEKTMEELSKLSINYENITQDVEEFEKIVRTGMYTSGESASEGFAEGITSTSDAMEATKAKSDEILAEYNGIPADTKKAGEETSKEFASGIDSESSTVTTSAAGVSSATSKELKDVEAYNIGNRIATEYAYGLESGLNTIQRAAYSLGLEARNGFGNGINGTMSFSVASIPRHATGGFVEDGLFFANHNELVGKFSNGKTAVANNEQILKGIAEAVYPAVYNAIMEAQTSASGGTGGNPEYIMNNISIDGETIARAVTKGQKNLDRRFNPSPQFG